MGLPFVEVFGANQNTSTKEQSHERSYLDTSQSVISPLHQRFIDDMTMRKLSPKTQIGYIRAVAKLARFLSRSPAFATAEDLRFFQLHLVSTGATNLSINATITGLRAFFDITLNRKDVTA